MSKINVRSPYYISNGVITGLNRTNIKIFIYTGTQTTSRPTAPTYNLSGIAINNQVTFEISELVKDYVNQTFSGAYSTEILWVDYRTTEIVNGVVQRESGFTQIKGFNGYGYFEDGANPQNNTALLQSNTSIVKLDDAPAVIAVDTSLTTRVTYELNGEQVYTKAITPPSPLTSSTQIEYVTSGVNGSDEFEDRVIQDGGIFEGSDCLTQFANEFTLFDFDTIYIDSSQGVTKLNVKSESECKYTPHKVTFINKYGTLQDVWFFKRSNKTLSTKKESFKRNTVTGISYSINKHQDTILTNQGSEKLTLNTGYYPESYNEVFKQMELSEECWIEIDSKSLPINISSSSLAFKTQLNDKIINYTIDVEFANNTINDIR